MSGCESVLDIKEGPGHPRDVGRRFSFGENWQRFSAFINDERIERATESLRDFLEQGSLAGKSFLDVGSGSGLFSLAAKRLGACRVHSFDFDPQSVACTQELRRRYAADDPHWTVESGSVLDREYLARLGLFDVVYSWGVLHHTGAMWQAIQNVFPLVAPGGLLYIALYNDQGQMSKCWHFLKRTYNQLPRLLRLPYAVALLLPHEAGVATAAALRLEPMRYIRSWTAYSRLSLRGMSRWHDWIDWIGGYPFETAQPRDVCRLARDHGFVLVNIATVGGRLGCNEYVFQKTR